MDWKYIYLIEAIILIYSIITYLLKYKKGQKNNWRIYCIIGIITIITIQLFIEKPKLCTDSNLVMEKEVGAEVEIPKITYHSKNTTKKDEVINENDNIEDEKKYAEKGKDGEPGTIYLTFDDGPSNTITPKILDILKEKNVKATFFILNYNSEEEKLVKREVEEGHTVGIHGYSHDYKKIYKSVNTYIENITKLQKKIKKSTGYNATITRFPGGSSNTISRFNPKIMTKLSKEVVNRGYKYFDWNITSGDAGDVKTSKGMYDNVTKGLSKKRINVVLMHDFGSNKKILKALPKIIDYAIEHGYKFSNITTNTPMVKHKINN